MIFDTLDQLEMYAPQLPALKIIAEVMDHDNVYDKEPGTYSTPDENVVYTVSEYMTSTADRPFEYHKEHSDVHIVLSGQELMSTSWRELKNQSPVFDRKGDVGYFQAEPISVLQASQGRFSVFFPGEAHKCGIALGEPALVRKVVFKVLD